MQKSRWKKKHKEAKSVLIVRTQKQTPTFQFLICRKKSFWYFGCPFPRKWQKKSPFHNPFNHERRSFVTSFLLNISKIIILNYWLLYVKNKTTNIHDLQRKHKFTAGNFRRAFQKRCFAPTRQVFWKYRLYWRFSRFPNYEPRHSNNKKIYFRFYFKIQLNRKQPPILLDVDMKLIKTKTWIIKNGLWIHKVFKNFLLSRQLTKFRDKS